MATLLANTQIARICVCDVRSVKIWHTTTRECQCEWDDSCLCELEKCVYICIYVFLENKPLCLRFNCFVNLFLSFKTRFLLRARWLWNFSESNQIAPYQRMEKWKSKRFKSIYIVLATISFSHILLGTCICIHFSSLNLFNCNRKKFHFTDIDSDDCNCVTGFVTILVFNVIYGNISGAYYCFIWLGVETGWSIKKLSLIFWNQYNFCFHLNICSWRDHIFLIICWNSGNNH